MKEKFLSKKELAEELGVSYPTLQEVIKDLPTYKVGMRHKYLLSEVLKAIRIKTE